jgi:hypothetical protein
MIIPSYNLGSEDSGGGDLYAVAEAQKKAQESAEQKARMAKFSPEDFKNAQIAGEAAFKVALSRYGSVSMSMVWSFYYKAYNEYLNKIEAERIVSDYESPEDEYQKAVNEALREKEESEVTLPVIEQKGFFSKNLIWILGGVAAIAVIFVIKKKREKKQ